LIQAWKTDHNWFIERLAQECSALAEDTISVGVMRDVVNGTASRGSAGSG
jgi:hypothetical protein